MRGDLGQGRFELCFQRLESARFSARNRAGARTRSARQSPPRQKQKPRGRQPAGFPGLWV